MHDGTQAWTTIKTFTSGEVVAEVSRAGDTLKYSYRLSWSEPGARRQGAWFPATGIPFLEDLTRVATDAEAFILAERDRELAEREGRIADRRDRERERAADHAKAAKKVKRGR